MCDLTVVPVVRRVKSSVVQSVGVVQEEREEGGRGQEGEAEVGVTLTRRMSPNIHQVLRSVVGPLEEQVED